jgi:tetratricopeptide (TPR) repeat protein
MFAKSSVLSILSLATIAFSMPLPILSAETEPAMPKGPAAGIQFTEMQDINPNAPAANRPVKQKWAVVIGISKFGEQRLVGDDLLMDKAAYNFYNYLVDPKGGRFAKDHVKLLVNNAATRGNIMNSLGSKWLGELAGPDDLIVVFVATEAFPLIEGGTYLATYDASLSNVYQTCISMQDLMGTLKKDLKTDRIVLVLESKYSGAANLESGAKAIFHGFNIDVDKVLLGKGNIILSSSRPNEETYGNDFSTSLIECLRAQNGLVPLSQAFAKAKEMTEFKTAHFSRGGKKQSPVLKSNWTGNDLVIGTPPAEEVSGIPSSVNAYLSAEAHYMKANQAVVNNQIDAAIAEYKQAISVDPTYADALSDYGTVLGYKGNWQEASEMFKRACAAKPNDSLFAYNYARSLKKLGNKEAYFSQMKVAYRLNPRDKDVLMALSEASRQADDSTGSIRYLQEALNLYPQNAELHNTLSVALYRAGALPQAIEHARQAISLNPKLTAARINLGSTLLSDGDLKGAADAYKEAIQIAPTDPEAHFGLSRTLEKLGDKGGAKSELNRFIESAPATDARLPAAKKRLSEL